MHYIFEVRIRPDTDYTAEDYAEAWERASAYIQSAAGAQGTRLHRKIGDHSVLLAIATWESKAARDAMAAKLPEVWGSRRPLGKPWKTIGKPYVSDGGIRKHASLAVAVTFGSTFGNIGSRNL